MAGTPITITVKLKDLLTGDWAKSVSAVKAGATKMRAAVNAVGTAVFSLKGLLVGVGGVALAKSFITAGDEAQRMGMRLTAVLGGNEEDAKALIEAFDDMASKFAVTDEALTDAFIQLRGQGITPTLEQLKNMAGVAAIFGSELTAVSSALMTLNERTLRQFGVSLDIVKEKAFITIGGMRIEVAKTDEAIRQGILKLWAEKYPDALAKASSTYSGMMLIFKNQWEEFKESVLQSGVMEALTEVMKALGTELKNMTSSKEAIRDVALFGVDAIQFLADAVKMLADTITFMRIAWNAFIYALGYGIKHGVDGMIALADAGKLLNTVIGGNNFIINLLIEQLDGLKNVSANVAGAMDEAKGKIEELLKGAEKGEGTFGNLSAKLTEIRKKIQDITGGGTTEKARRLGEIVGFNDDDISKAKQFLEEFEKFRKKSQEVKKEVTVIKDTFRALADSLASNLMNIFDDLLEGKVKPLRDYVRDILKDLAKVAVETVVKKVIEIAFSALAEGGVVKGGFKSLKPVRGYATGGRIRAGDVHVGVVGEGASDEIVVPIPGGEVPVKMKGGGGRGAQYYTVNIQAVDAKSIQRLFAEQEDTIKGMLFKWGRENPSVARGFAY